MTIRRFSFHGIPAGVLVVVLLLTSVPSAIQAQDRLPTMPGYDRYQEMAPKMDGAVVTGSVFAEWAEDGASFEYGHDGKRFRFDISTGSSTLIPGDPPNPYARFMRRGGPARGRQYESAVSPDSTLEAVYRDRNLYLRNVYDGKERAITTDGNEEDRTKNGSASWVYGEELRQNTAMWWSPDGSKLAFYRFDESGVQDYYLQMDQTRIQSSLDVEAYPKAGTPNPVVQLFVYDLASGVITEIDVRDGQPFTNEAVGHYVYAVEWSPDGKELDFNRTNRRQNIMEYVACDPSSGTCRVMVREEWPDSWVENHPPLEYLQDGERFLWISERTGFRNLFLYNRQGKLLNTLTDHTFEVADIVEVTEEEGVVYYTARSGDNHMKIQLHRVGLDGSGDRRLTDPAFRHTVSFAPDGKHFLDTAETHDQPPVTTLMTADGEGVATVAESDLTRFQELGLRKVEMFTFYAADGVTQLHGMLHKPSNFDPTREYPVLVSVYAGPGSTGARETFTVPNALTEYGFLVVTLDARSASGRGKRFMDAIYLNLSNVEIHDLAGGIRSLWDRPYVQKGNAGIFGTSYGGTASLMGLLLHPEVFSAASASSAVTDWRHYDTIYTERFMWIPQENDGYQRGSAMAYAEELDGALMLYFGTADNNVHPSNTMQMIQALQTAGKSFEVQVGPDLGHTGLDRDRMMEFFIENMVLDWEG